MSVEGSTLIVRVDAFKFWFEEPLGNPFDLSRYFGEKQQALRHLLSCKFPLSQDLQKRIAAHIKFNESKSGFWKLMILDICIPSGLLLGGNFDYDRDLDVLRKEVQAALARAPLRPSEYELAEHIQSEERFSTGGKPLFRVYVS